MVQTDDGVSFGKETCSNEEILEKDLDVGQEMKEVKLGHITKYQQYNDLDLFWGQLALSCLM